MEPIKLEISILPLVTKVWEYFTQPEHITKCNFASDVWPCPAATNDLKVGGAFSYRMEMKEDDFGFDFKGVYDEIIPLKLIKYHLDDGRKVEVHFESIDADTTLITEIFEPDPQEMFLTQRDGWYAILNNFHKYVENN